MVKLCESGAARVLAKLLSVGDLDLNVWPEGKLKPGYLPLREDFPNQNDCIPLVTAIRRGNLASVKALLSLRPDQELNAFVLAESTTALQKIETKYVGGIHVPANITILI